MKTKSYYIKHFLLVKLKKIIQNINMNHILLYSSIFIASTALFLCLYACVRVGQFISATKDLNWDDIANITGDLATTKKTIQTLNNRLNGMHSPKVQEQELLMQLMQNAPNQMTNGKIKNVGG